MKRAHGVIVIDLWVWRLDVDAGERRRLEAFLSADEIARAHRFVFARDRERFIAGRGRLREILATRLAMPPAGLVFSYSETGKPNIGTRAAELQFNLSHSAGLAALVVTEGIELGVDIEQVRPLKEDIATRFFSPREVAYLKSLSEAEQLPAFYRCWTRKEAVLKATGEGLRRALNSFDVAFAADAPARVDRMEGEANPVRDWRLVAFDPADGLAGAIACRTGGAEVELRRGDKQ